MNKRPTIQTVAELAGVSRGTVDRVLNNRSYVRADVRARVLNAIQETGYLSPKEAHRQAAEAKLPLKPVRLHTPLLAQVFRYIRCFMLYFSFFPNLGAIFCGFHRMCALYDIYNYTHQTL